jgi:hypothetical protein
MEEIWKDVKEFTGIYQASNKGRVRTLDRLSNAISSVGRPYTVKVSGRIVAISKYPNGYSYVNINVDGKRGTRLVHRLVAEAFIPNPDNLPQVNHKDENIENNCVENLEWCTAKYNANYGTRNARCFHYDQQKAINQFTKDGVFIKHWNGIGEASKALGISDSHIIRVCKHMKRNVSAGGYKWEYA